MKQLSFALLLVTMVSSTGCFVGRGLGVAYNRAASFGATVVAPTVAPVGAVATSSNVTINGQPATASVAVGPNGVSMAAGGPGASVSTTVAVPTP